MPERGHATSLSRVILGVALRHLTDRASRGLELIDDDVYVSSTDCTKVSMDQHASECQRFAHAFQQN